MEESASAIQGIENGPALIAGAVSVSPAMITAIAILVSAGIGALIAIVQIRHQREVARKRATLDMLVAREWDHHYPEIRTEYIKLRNADGGLEAWADHKYANSPQQMTINNILNEYELIATGIREDILDIELYARWFRGALLRDYASAMNYIRATRQRIRSDSAFSETEWLAVEWGGEKIPRTQPGSGPNQ